jgi:putative transposase
MMKRMSPARSNRGQTGPCARLLPNEKAITRLSDRAVLLERNDEWAVQRARCMMLETIAQLGDDTLVLLPAVAA